MSVHDALVAVRVGIAAVGGLSSLWSFRLGLPAARNRWIYVLLAVGFGLVAFGAIAEGILFEFGGWDLIAAHTAEAFLGILAFSAILLAIVRSRV